MTDDGRDRVVVRLYRVQQIALPDLFIRAGGVEDRAGAEEHRLAERAEVRYVRVERDDYRLRAVGDHHVLRRIAVRPGDRAAVPREDRLEARTDVLRRRDEAEDHFALRLRRDDVRLLAAADDADVHRRLAEVVVAP